MPEPETSDRYVVVNEITMTCESCPAQWEGRTKDNRPIYIRYRWGYLSVSLGEPGEDVAGAVRGEEIFGQQLGDELHGVMSYEELREATKNILVLPPAETA